MIIDIDIKIADSNGKMLQHFVKRLDNIDAADDRLKFSLDIGKSFEQFLAEYMSYSGRRIQERLFADSRYPLSGQYDLSGGSYPSEKSGSREIQYLIRVGNGSIFSGKFPVKQLIEVRDMREPQGAEPVNSHETGCEDLNYLMQKAIEKYETTFYHIVQEQNVGAVERQVGS
ncbi:MAG TPA: hypothetical protein GXX75_03080 [Clostridiales bacterium]|nr:hypothetical protein [Clostridiales bacterium]